MLHRPLARLVSLALCGAALTAPGCAWLARLGPGATLEDEDYRFVLTRPGPGWRLLSEAEIQRIIPDAVAGIADERRSLFAVVIVEQAPHEDLPALAQLIVDNAAVEDKKVLPTEELLFGGERALRYQMTGVVRGMPLRYVNTIFLHQGTLYQLMAWGPFGTTAEDGSTFKPIWEAFALRQGEVHGRSAPRLVPDTMGVGWRVKGGIYENAVFGLRAAPPAGWRVAVGSELREMNDDAAVALVHRQPDIYLIAIVEHARTSERDAFLGRLVEQTAKGLGAPRLAGNQSYPVAGEPMALSCYGGPEGNPYEFLHGVRLAGDQALQLMAWYAERDRDAALKLMPAAFAALGLLGGAERAQLSAELAAVPDAQNVVGPTFALRRGLYLDFEQGFSWRKPTGFVDVATGEEARAVNGEATLFVEDTGSGIMALVLVEPAAQWDGPTYHATIVENVIQASVEAPPVAVTLGDAQGLVTEAHTDRLGFPLTYRIVTTVFGAQAAQLLVWGTPDNMRAGADRAAAMVQGWQWHQGGLLPIVETPTHYRDLRMGYQLALPPGPWQREELDNPALKSMGHLLRWQRPRQAVLLLSFCALQEGQNEQWFIDLVTRTFAEQLRGAFAARPEQSATELGGQQGLHMRWRGATSTDAFVALRDKTFYALLVMEEHAPTAGFVEQVHSGFAFLE